MIGALAMVGKAGTAPRRRIRPAGSDARSFAERRLSKVENILAGSFLRARSDALASVSLATLEALIIDAGRSLAKSAAAPSWYEGGVSAMSLLGRPYRVLWLKPAAFFEVWRGVGQFVRRPSPSIIDAIGDRVAAGVMLTPPAVANLGRSWGFLEGRNRFLYALSVDADLMPFAVPEADAAEFNSLFGGAPSPTPGEFTLAPTVGLAGQPLNLFEAIERIAHIFASRFYSSVVAAANAVAEDEAGKISIALSARARAKKLEVDVDFSAPNVNAINELQLAALNLIVQMSEEQLEVITRVLRDGIARGINPNQMAREIRSAVSLTMAQEGYVENYRRALQRAHLDPSAAANATERALHDGRYTRPIRAATASGQPLSAKQVDDMTERYRERMIAHRSRVIARTQALRAVHMGEAGAWEAAIASGDITAAEVTQTWHTARDERVRFSHRTLEGQQRGWGAAFQTYSGTELRFPGDPTAPPRETIQCRCVLTRQISAEPIAAIG